MIGQPYAQGKAVGEGNRQAIPCVRQNDSFVRRNQVQVNGFVESIARGDNQVAGIRAQLNIGQYFFRLTPVHQVVLIRSVPIRSEMQERVTYWSCD